MLRDYVVGLETVHGSRKEEQLPESRVNSSILCQVKSVNLSLYWKLLKSKYSRELSRTKAVGK